MQINRNDTAVVFIDPQIQRASRDIGAREQDVGPPRSIESRRVPRVGCRLARAVQALYRGREDRRRQSPQDVGPQTNDLALQLRKRGISKVILGGMLANMCVESHLRDLLEQGFEVLVARDATAAPRHPEWGYGYTAALINFRFSEAHGSWGRFANGGWPCRESRR